MREDDSILLVEDNADDAFILERALRKAGLNNRLEVVGSGGEAMRYLAGEARYAGRVAHPVPGLVLLSADLRGVSGFYVLQWMRGQPKLARVPVVMFSDFPEEEELPLQMLGTAWVVRPADFSEMVRVLRQLRVSWLDAPFEGENWGMAA